MANGNISDGKIVTWTLRLLEILLLGILAFYASDMHGQVYKEIPDHISELEKRADNTYVRKERFSDFCRRFDIMENKIDDIGKYIRDKGGPK